MEELFNNDKLRGIYVDDIYQYTFMGIICNNYYNITTHCYVCQDNLTEDDYLCLCRCGHILHKKCLENCINNQVLKCGICKKNMIKKTEVFE